jgi:D-xylulose reductase
MVLGHESAGVVHSVGDGVKSLKPGDRVCMEPGIPCRRCTRCREGRYNLCPEMAFAATPPYDGTLAKFWRLPEDFCYVLPEHIPLEQGALMEPASVAVHVCRQVEMRPGKSLVVFGAGPVGLLCCAVAKALGASKIISVDINEERVKFAQDYAATHVFRPEKSEKPEESTERMVKECGLGFGADAAVDATGAGACIQMGIHVLRPGGMYCQAGMVQIVNLSLQNTPLISFRVPPRSHFQLRPCA